MDTSIEQLKIEFPIVDPEIIGFYYKEMCNRDIQMTRDELQRGLDQCNAKSSCEEPPSCDTSDTEEPSTLDDEGNEPMETIMNKLSFSGSMNCESFLPKKFVMYNGTSRYDMRDYNVITIDSGENLKRYDDSVHCIEHGDIIEFAVHCYDPSEFVNHHTYQDHSLSLGHTRITYSFLFFYDRKNKKMVDFITFHQ